MDKFKSHRGVRFAFADMGWSLTYTLPRSFDVSLCSHCRTRCHAGVCALFVLSMDNYAVGIRYHRKEEHWNLQERRFKGGCVCVNGESASDGAIWEADRHTGGHCILHWRMDGVYFAEQMSKQQNNVLTCKVQKWNWNPRKCLHI